MATVKDFSVEEKLTAVLSLQKIDSKIDEIKTVKGNNNHHSVQSPLLKPRSKECNGHNSSSSVAVAVKRSIIPVLDVSLSPHASGITDDGTTTTAIVRSSPCIEQKQVDDNIIVTAASDSTCTTELLEDTTTTCNQVKSLEGRSVVLSTMMITT